MEMTRFRIHYLMRPTTRHDWEEKKYEVTAANPESAWNHVRTVHERHNIVMLGKVKALRPERWRVR